MPLAALEARAADHGLILRGAFHPRPGDALPEGTGTLLLFGPDEPGFWPIFAASDEYADEAPDPLDRWSARVLGDLATRWGGTAILPSDGPPWPPFLTWARRSGRAFPSPIGLFVHDRVGLMISYRGAIALPQRLALPTTGPAPCPGCIDRPCASACPVGALREGAAYDVPACQHHLRRPEGRECRLRGCLAQRACPLSANLHRDAAQASFHMAAFREDWPGTEGGNG